MMNRPVFRCDRIFEGFLSAVFLAYKLKVDPVITGSGAVQAGFLQEVHNVLTDMEAAERVKAGILREIGDEGLHNVRSAYACYDDRKEDVIYRYLRLVFKQGARVLTMYHEPEVIDFDRLAMLTRGEVHRMLGFLRFIEMQSGVFYAPLKTDNDILEFVLPHFMRRLNSQRFVIHDLKRGKIALYDGNSSTIGHMDGEAEIMVSEREVEFNSLWKKYFKTVSITERENPRLQRGFAPKKYRSTMSEFSE